MSYAIYNPNEGVLQSRRRWNPISTGEINYTTYDRFDIALEAARGFAGKHLINAKQALNSKIINTYRNRIPATEFHKMPGTRVYDPNHIYVITKLFINLLYPHETHPLDSLGAAVAELFHHKHTLENVRYILRHDYTPTDSSLLKALNNGLTLNGYRSWSIYSKVFSAGFAVSPPVWFSGEFLFFASKKEAITFRLADDHSWVGFDLVEIMERVEKEVKEGLYPG